MAQPASELKDHLGYWLRYVSNHVSQAFAAKVAERGVSVAEWVLLRLLYPAEQLSPSQLASELGMTKGAITKIVDRLVDRKLVLRRAHRDDGRAQTVSLTSHGAKLVPALAKLADENDAHYFSQLTAAERSSLRRLLQKLVKSADMTTIPVD
jgi:DNA-binding MarR family transcriptional regulator